MKDPLLTDSMQVVVREDWLRKTLGRPRISQAGKYFNRLATLSSVTLLEERDGMSHRVSRAIP